ncbi:MAG: endonuclease Q family protein [Candidatus Pacearchaeota archaeon]|nr:endonuclease Q family protein [Candidatus Pacearchaeota archaeon]
MEKETDLTKGIIADLHIHSKYSRATSKNLSLENLEKYAKIKGVNLLGTGDFQHPEWSKELDTLEERDGILYSKTGFPFVWQTEISLMYTQGRGRRVHFVILAPSREVAKQITKFLGSKGRLDYDGRPIFGFSAIELVEAMEKIDNKIEIIPAHCMTPWFGIFGSKTGFDSLKECFGDKENKIHAVETGLSADPEMLQHFSFLNNRTILSFSDLHSFWPWRIAREATIFKKPEGELSYKELVRQIRENDILGTIETDPAYGKYHWDGHRNCDFSCSPEQTSKFKGICPVCGKSLTVGVEYRVNQLTNQQINQYPRKKPFFKILPLHELISFSIGSPLASKKTWAIYDKMIEKLGNEFHILIEVEKPKLVEFGELLAELIMKNRVGNLKVKPGYDGTYGEIDDIVKAKVGDEDAKEIKPLESANPQKKLF